MVATTSSKADVIIVGAGNAALCAALAAAEHNARVLVLEAAPESEAGGNSRFTAGAMRVAHEGIDDLRSLLPDLSEEDLSNTEFGRYSREQFYDDLGRLTHYRTDPDLAEVLIENSLETLRWMRSKGVRFQPSYGRQAFKVDGRFKFWGGLCIETWGGGPGLVDTLIEVASKAGVDILYDTPAIALLKDDTGVTGVRVRQNGKEIDLHARSVILASGGFEANTRWRTQYLGPGWDLAKVRGSRFNMGDGIRMALDIGAMSYGNWSGCHAVGWDQNAPEFGDLAVGDNFQKHSYPFGIMVNATGRRFVDEGADLRNYTYAKYGRVILEQPGQFCWQVFDAKVDHLLRDEYRIRQVTKATGDTLEALASNLEGVDAQAFVDEVTTYNSAVRDDLPFNPTVLDGRHTEGLSVPKSNWANTLDTPPYSAYATTCGITFTFGGLRINPQTNQVLDTAMQPIPGLYAAGELVGGLFYFNYPGGSGLTAGAVFGRRAGQNAAST